MLIVKYINFET